jgi:tetratricopeptide (TPR) repeat protein
MLKRMETVFRRENQASTIITRNYGPFVKRVVEAREKPIEELAELIVQKELFDLYFEDIVDDATTSESKVMYTEELAHEAVEQIFERLSFEVVDQIYDDEVERYIETQIRILEELRLRLEAERLALEVERKRLEEDMERARKEEEERKRAEAQRIAIEVEERRRADKKRRDAEKDQQQQREKLKKAGADVVAVSEVPAKGDDNSPVQQLASVDEDCESSNNLFESFDDGELHKGTHEERADRARSLKKYCRFELANSILFKLIKECLEEEEEDDESAIVFYFMMSGECYFELGQISAAREQYARATDKMQGRQDKMQAAEVQIGLASVLQEQGLFKEAEQAFNSARTIVTGFESSLDWHNVGPKEKMARRVLVSVNVGLSELHRATGEYHLAERAVDAALDLVKDRFENSDVEKKAAYAATLNAEARIYTAQGLLTDAVVAHNEALVLLVEFHATEQHPSIAATLTDLGMLSLDMSKLDEAQHFIEKGLEIRHHFFDDGSPRIADSYFAFATLLMIRGRYNEAQAMMLKARDIWLDVLGKGHHLHAQALHGLADVAIAQEQYAVAQQLYESALFIKRGSLQTTEGPLREHWLVAKSLHGLGQCKVTLGSAHEALDLFEEAFRVCDANLSLMDVENHWKLEEIRISIAAAHLQLGRPHEAHAYLQGTLKYLQAKVGEVSLIAATGMLVLGRIWTALGRFNDAYELLRHCGEVHEKVFGLDTLNLSSLADHQAVGFNHLGLGRVDAALDACSLCLNIFCAIRDSRSVSEEALGASVWRVLHLRAQALREAEFLEDARVFYELALTQCREIYGVRSAAYVILLGDLADCLRRQRKFQLAEVALDESLKLRREVLGEGHYLVGELERSAALLLLDVDCPDLALARMESRVAPIMRAALDQEDTSHPELMFNRGIEGLCIRAKHKSSESAGQVREIVLQAQSLIDDALDYFDVYPQGKFSDLHPFILRLGGFGSTIRSTWPKERLCDNSPYLSLRGLESEYSPDSPEKKSTAVFD